MRLLFAALLLSCGFCFATPPLEDAVKTCAGDFLSGENAIDLQDLKAKDGGWKILPHLQTMLDDSRIPKQLYDDELLSLSCGPISMAKSLHLLGEPLQQDVLSWVLDFPYFEAGVLPKDLIEQTQPSLRKFSPKFVMSNDFAKVMTMVRRELNMKRPVVALLVLGAARQHYLTWAGYNDKLKLALLADTDGILNAVPYKALECIMYAGSRTDENASYNLAVENALAYFATLTQFDLYNLIKFEPK